jgi:hypothetical protein
MGSGGGCRSRSWGWGYAGAKIVQERVGASDKKVVE